VIQHQDTIDYFASLRTISQHTAASFAASLLHRMGTIMGDLINLKRFKKRAARDQAAKQAEANRAKFSRDKAERTLEKKRAGRANDLLDQHLIDSEDVS
jgi:uncharacterized membrane-anchored protein YhcB (DUF1043 family)